MEENSDTGEKQIAPRMKNIHADSLTDVSK